MLLAAALAATMPLSNVDAQQELDPASQEKATMRVCFSFNGMTMTATLYDNPSARDFYSMLPLELDIEDYGSNEKITYLPRKLTEQGRGAFDNEQPYDLCYFMAWGNLAMFYASYKHPGLIRLGRFDEGYQALHAPGKFPLRIDTI